MVSMSGSLSHWSVWGGAQDFLRWWGGELREFLPGKLGGRQAGPGARLTCRLNEASLVCYLCTGETAEEIATLGPEASDEGSFTALLEIHFPQRPKLVLQLPKQMVVRRRVSLPAAAKDNLRQVLGFEMDRQTPFQAKDVYFDYRVLESNAGEVVVELNAVPRVMLDPWLDKLDRLGLEPGAVDVADGESAADLSAPARVNLLPVERVKARSRGPQARVNLGLAGLALVLLAVVLATPMWQMERSLSGLERDIQMTRAKAEEVVQLRAQLQQRIEATNQLLDRKQLARSEIEALNELAQLLPDDTWLSQLDIRKDKIIINGESGAASQLIGLIEASKYFSSAAFVSPVTQARGSGGERFQMSIDLDRG